MEPVQSLESEFCHYHYLPLLHWTSYFSVLLLSHVWNGSNSSTYTMAYCDHTEGPHT